MPILRGQFISLILSAFVAVGFAGGDHEKAKRPLGASKRSRSEARSEARSEELCHYRLVDRMMTPDKTVLQLSPFSPPSEKFPFRVQSEVSTAQPRSVVEKLELAIDQYFKKKTGEFRSLGEPRGISQDQRVFEKYLDPSEEKLSDLMESIVYRLLTHPVSGMQDSKVLDRELARYEVAYLLLFSDAVRCGYPSHFLETFQQLTWVLGNRLLKLSEGLDIAQADKVATFIDRMNSLPNLSFLASGNDDFRDTVAETIAQRAGSLNKVLGSLAPGVPFVEPPAPRRLGELVGRIKTKLASQNSQLLREEAQFLELTSSPLALAHGVLDRLIGPVQATRIRDKLRGASRSESVTLPKALAEKSYEPADFGSQTPTSDSGFHWTGGPRWPKRISSMVDVERYLRASLSPEPPLKTGGFHITQHSLDIGSGSADDRVQLRKTVMEELVQLKAGRPGFVTGKLLSEKSSVENRLILELGLTNALKWLDKPTSSTEEPLENEISAFDYGHWAQMERQSLINRLRDEGAYSTAASDLEKLELFLANQAVPSGLPSSSRVNLLRLPPLYRKLLVSTLDMSQGKSPKEIEVLTGLISRPSGHLIYELFRKWNSPSSPQGADRLAGLVDSSNKSLSSQLSHLAHLSLDEMERLRDHIKNRVKASVLSNGRVSAELSSYEDADHALAIVWNLINESGHSDQTRAEISNRHGGETRVQREIALGVIAKENVAWRAASDRHRKIIWHLAEGVHPKMLSSISRREIAQLSDDHLSKLVALEGFMLGSYASRWGSTDAKTEFQNLLFAPPENMGAAIDKYFQLFHENLYAHLVKYGIGAPVEGDAAGDRVVHENHKANIRKALVDGLAQGKRIQEIPDPLNPTVQAIEALYSLDAVEQMGLEQYMAITNPDKPSWIDAQGNHGGIGPGLLPHDIELQRVEAQQAFEELAALRSTLFKPEDLKAATKKFEGTKRAFESAKTAWSVQFTHEWLRRIAMRKSLESSPPMTDEDAMIGEAVLNDYRTKHTGSAGSMLEALSNPLLLVSDQASPDSLRKARLAHEVLRRQLRNSTEPKDNESALKYEKEAQGFERGLRREAAAQYLRVLDLTSYTLAAHNQALLKGMIPPNEIFPPLVSRHLPKLRELLGSTLSDDDFNESVVNLLFEVATRNTVKADFGNFVRDYERSHNVLLADLLDRSESPVQSLIETEALESYEIVRRKERDWAARREAAQSYAKGQLKSAELVAQGVLEKRQSDVQEFKKFQEGAQSIKEIIDVPSAPIPSEEAIELMGEAFSKGWKNKMETITNPKGLAASFFKEKMAKGHLGETEESAKDKAIAKIRATKLDVDKHTAKVEAEIAIDRLELDKTLMSRQGELRKKIDRVRAGQDDSERNRLQSIVSEFLKTVPMREAMAQAGLVDNPMEEGDRHDLFREDISDLLVKDLDRYVNEEKNLTELTDGLNRVGYKATAHDKMRADLLTAAGKRFTEGSYHPGKTKFLRLSKDSAAHLMSQADATSKAKSNFVLQEIERHLKTLSEIANDGAVHWDGVRLKWGNLELWKLNKNAPGSARYREALKELGRYTAAKTDILEEIQDEAIRTYDVLGHPGMEGVSQVKDLNGKISKPMEFSRTNPYSGHKEYLNAHSAFRIAVLEGKEHVVFEALKPVRDEAQEAYNRVFGHGKSREGLDLQLDSAMKNQYGGVKGGLYRIYLASGKGFDFEAAIPGWGLGRAVTTGETSGKMTAKWDTSIFGSVRRKNRRGINEFNTEYDITARELEEQFARARGTLGALSPITIEVPTGIKKNGDRLTTPHPAEEAFRQVLELSKKLNTQEGMLIEGMDGSITGWRDLGLTAATLPITFGASAVIRGTPALVRLAWATRTANYLASVGKTASKAYMMPVFNELPALVYENNNYINDLEKWVDQVDEEGFPKDSAYLEKDDAKCPIPVHLDQNGDCRLDFVQTGGRHLWSAGGMARANWVYPDLAGWAKQGNQSFATFLINPLYGNTINRAVGASSWQGKAVGKMFGMGLASATVSASVGVREQGFREFFGNSKNLGEVALQAAKMTAFASPLDDAAIALTRPLTAYKTSQNLLLRIAGRTAASKLTPIAGATAGNSVLSQIIPRIEEQVKARFGEATQERRSVVGNRSIEDEWDYTKSLFFSNIGGDLFGGRMSAEASRTDHLVQRLMSGSRAATELKNESPQDYQTALRELRTRNLTRLPRKDEARSKILDEYSRELGLREIFVAKALDSIKTVPIYNPHSKEVDARWTAAAKELGVSVLNLRERLKTVDDLVTRETVIADLEATHGLPKGSLTAEMELAEQRKTDATSLKKKAISFWKSGESMAHLVKRVQDKEGRRLRDAFFDGKIVAEKLFTGWKKAQPDPVTGDNVPKLPVYDAYQPIRLAQINTENPEHVKVVREIMKYHRIENEALLKRILRGIDENQDVYLKSISAKGNAPDGAGWNHDRLRKYYEGGDNLELYILLNAKPDPWATMERAIPRVGPPRG